MREFIILTLIVATIALCFAIGEYVQGLHGPIFSSVTAVMVLCIGIGYTAIKILENFLL